MNHLDRSLLNWFSATPLDRAFERRKDEVWLRERLTQPSSRFFPLLDLHCLIDDALSPRPVVLGADTVSPLLEHDPPLVFLGCDDDVACFALDLRDLGGADLFPGRFVDLKSVSRTLDRHDAAVLGYARAMLYWQRRQRFCSVCGAPTRSVQGGHVLVCANAGCAVSHFPRTDPAVIVAVTDAERCLLARQRSWPPGQYSVIAGFVEPGESLEHAVVREVFEETGIAVNGVHYHSSQPWPFPCSIMLGFSAHAIDPSIRLHDGELHDAQWYSRDELRDAIVGEALRIPPPVSIAYRLIEDWFDVGVCGRLADVVRLGLPWRST